MLRKIINEMNGISRVSKKIVFIGVGAGLALLFVALGMSLVGNLSLSLKYLYEQMAKTSATLFAQGVVFGLGCDFLLNALGRKGK